jgi:TFIIF-interacting CTD phosphatase-like protein
MNLDSALIYSDTSLTTGDFAIDVNYSVTQCDQSGKPQRTYIIKRFGVEYFLTEMARYYTLVVFSTSDVKYTNQIVS